MKWQVLSNLMIQFKIIWEKEITLLNIQKLQIWKVIINKYNSLKEIIQQIRIKIRNRK